MIGETISHYRILAKLGEGGMGVVYKAEDTGLRRTIALKFLAPDAIGSKEARARFLREARMAASLNHPNICTIHEVGDGNEATSPWRAVSHSRAVSRGTSGSTTGLSPVSSLRIGRVLPAGSSMACKP